MNFIFFIGGVIVGIVVTIIFNRNGKTFGVIAVDHNIQACKLYVTSKDLLERKNKKAIFTIDHEAKITRHTDLSREEQIL